MIRRILYFIYTIILIIKNKNIKISPTSMIKKRTVIGRYVKIGKNSWIDGEIGSYTYIEKNCEISARIGKYCSIGSDVKTVAGNHPLNMLSTSPVFYGEGKECGKTFFKNDQVKIRNEISETGFDVDIGNDVWIGERVLIKGGIKISDGCVIGMGSVVTKDTLPYGVYAGNPAKLIKFRINEKDISDIYKLQWWEKDENWIENNIEQFTKKY